MVNRFYIHILLLALTAMMLACGPSGNQFKIEGRFKDMQEGELYIYNMSDDNARFDTLRVKGGSFVYQGTAEAPTPYLLVFPNAMEQVIFVDAGKTLEYEASTTDLKNYTVKGSNENNLLNEFREETKKMTPIKTKAAAKTFIENHPASPVSIYMLDRYFVQDDNIVYDELAQLVALLLKHHPNNLLLIHLQTDINQAGNTDVGKTIPKMKLESKSGKSVDLGSPGKNYMLVAFWATWMEEQWDFTPKLRNYGRNYSEQMRVVGISLDTQIYKWEEAVAPDSMIVDHVCDGKGWDSPAVVKFGIRFLPFYVLTDKNGKIIASGKGLDEMDRDVDKFVKKNVKQDVPLQPSAPINMQDAAGNSPAAVDVKPYTPNPANPDVRPGLPLKKAP